jgi:hypothetical protein
MCVRYGKRADLWRRERSAIFTPGRINCRKNGGSRQPVIQQSLTPFCMEIYTGMYRPRKYVLFHSSRVA